MMYNSLSLPLAIGIILFNTASAGSLEAVRINRNSEQSIINANFLRARQITAQVSSTNARAEKTNYLSLMNAGYTANQNQDYLSALNHFQEALTLQPGDSKAEKAVKNISSYGFDLYMRAGYAADQIRDYTEALQQFQKALKIRPDSWYAQQAVSNITHYLAQQPVESNNQKDNGLNLWLMLMGILVVSGLSGGLLFYLFKKTGNSLEEEEFEHSELPESIAGFETEPTESVSDVESNFEPKHRQETSINFEPQSATTLDEEKVTPSTTKNKQPKTTSDNNAPVISARSSLVKLDIVPELIQDLSTSDRSLRRKTVWELAQRGDSRAMKPLVELMVEVDSQERGLILEAMTQIAGRTLKPMNKAIMMSLEDDNAQVKQNAIRDLTRVYELMSQVTKRLSLVVEDSDTQVQETAKWALQKLNQMPVTPAWEVDNLNNQVNGINGSNSNSNSTNGTNMGNEPNYPLN